MSTLMINGIEVVTPRQFKVSVSDIDAETGRNARGETIRDRIAIKRKLDCEWGMLTQLEMQQLLSAVVNEFFSITYPDPQLGKITKTFYVGDRSAPAYSWSEGLKPWSGLSMQFIER